MPTHSVLMIGDVPVLAQMVQQFEKWQTSILAVREVPQDQTRRSLDPLRQSRPRHPRRAGKRCDSTAMTATGTNSSRGSK